MKALALLVCLACPAQWEKPSLRGSRPQAYAVLTPVPTPSTLPAPAKRSILDERALFLAASGALIGGLFGFGAAGPAGAAAGAVVGSLSGAAVWMSRSGGGP